MKITYNIRKGINKEKCEDSALLNTNVLNAEYGGVELKNVSKVCVGDGVGGNAGGDVASKYIMRKVSDINLISSIEELKKKLLEINDSLITYAAGVIGYENMATTFTGIFFDNNSTYLAHCGNTRVYVQQGSFLKQVTEDQTTYQWLVMTGNDEAAENCNKSEIRGAFGGGNRKFADTLVVKEVFKRGIPACILMTSDGIHDMLDIDEIEDVIMEEPLSSEEKIGKLINEAVKKGSQDDCTAVLIELS